MLKKNINEIKLTYSEKRCEIEMPSFKKEVLSNVYEMRPYLIVYVVAWPMIGYLPYPGKFSYQGADILTFFLFNNTIITWGFGQTLF